MAPAPRKFGLFRSDFTLGLAFLLVSVLIFNAHTAADLARMVHDDAFYYFGIARNLAAGRGSTFDGVVPTNGYHPLWLLVCTPFGPLLSASPQFGAELLVVLSALLLLVALIWQRRLIARLGLPKGGWAVSIAGLPLICSNIHGMEAGLSALLWIALLWTGLKRGLASPSGGVTFGLLGALLTLARLDCAIYVLALGAMLAWRDRRLASAATALAVYGAMMALYLAVNKAQFGHPLTISMLVKGGRAGKIGGSWLSSALAYMGLLSALLAPLAAFVTPKGKDAPVMWAISIATLLHVAAISSRGGSEVYEWYFTLPVLNLAFFVAALADRWPARSKLFLGASLAAMALLSARALVVRAHRPSDFQAKAEKADFLLQHAPRGTRIAEPDCGILGYFSGVPVLNIDGLTSDFSMQDAIGHGRLAEWLTDHGVNAIVLPAGHPDATVLLPDRLGMKGTVCHIRAVIQTVPIASNERYGLYRILRLEDVAGK